MFEISVYSKLLYFLFHIYGMIHIMDIYKSLNINTETVMKNSEMLSLALDHLKTKNNV